ncbi:hypothetical protein [Deinococcus humi]|uniref:Uncharacterized protein n=1 Tax=Deinococcus humi TaxID=662880 RepID=A0A7W8JQJ8_9DEIO|nr:hypothetical protein [Deinococcus humi]MBB5361294.1 hypothetical protein [Deinococcus humi]GGO19355.1 hypothetical protein GCM10008949_03600 [Deinococcus humi]
MSNLHFQHDHETQARIAQAQSEERRAELQALRIAVAERVYGFKPCEEGVWLTPLDIQNGDPYEAFTLLEELPEYSTDLNACSLAEGRVLFDLGFEDEYVAKLRAMYERGVSDWISWERFLLELAPEVKCRAMLAALAQAEGQQAQGEG